MPRSLPKTRVLVVDDDADMRLVVTVTLELGGYDVISADGPDQAIVEIESDPPDVVVLDVMMPGTSGIQFLEILRDRPDTSQTPVLVYSCLDTSEVADATARAGRAVSLVKPASPRQLGAAVASLVALG